MVNVDNKSAMSGDAVFLEAVNHAMVAEVGPFWNPNHPSVASGSIATATDRKQTGYVNDPKDAGGETKFGIAKNSNMELDISKLTWGAAQRIYFKNYWVAGDCSEIAQFAPRLAMLHFDGCINHGNARAAKLLQSAVGATVDGDIGPGSLAAIKRACALPNGEREVCKKLADLRIAFYNGIVSKKPDQSRFLKGWLSRISTALSFAISGL